MTLAAVIAHEAPVAQPEVGTISIDAVHVGRSLRAAGIDPLHVAALAEVAAHWPPIVLNRADASVIDGHHRIAAARQLGLRELRVTWFDGSPDDAYLEFVRCNVGHGLPLTLAERRHAARQMLRCYRRALGSGHCLGLRRLADDDRAPAQGAGTRSRGPVTARAT